MDPLQAALTNFHPFAQLPRDAIVASLPLWKPQRLAGGKLLWKQGRAADTCAIVHAGSLDVLVHGTRLAEVHAGEMVGELTIFITGAQRLASLEAREPTTLISLDSAGLRSLHDQQNPLYTAILDHALTAAAHRLHHVDHQISQLHAGNFATPPPAPDKGLLTRLWHRVRPEPAPDPKTRPPIAPLLARHPALQAVHGDLRDQLAAAFTPLHFRKATTIVREDDPDTRAFLLAAGTIDAMRTIEARGAARLIARFAPGSLFGVQSTFLPDDPRRETLLATSDGWAYTIDRPAVLALPAPTRLAWKEAALATIAGQAHAADLALLDAIRAFTTRHHDAMPSMVVPAEQAWLTGVRPGDSVADLRLSHPAPKRRR